HSGASPGTPGPATSRVAAAPPAPAAPAAPAAPMVWDDRQKAAFGFIERAGVFEWLVSDNDVRAFDAKPDLARRLGLRGVSMWVTGDEEPGMWSRFRPRRLELAPGAAAVVAAGATGAPAA